MRIEPLEMLRAGQTTGGYQHQCASVTGTAALLSALVTIPADNPQLLIIQPETQPVRVTWDASGAPAFGASPLGVLIGIGSYMKISLDDWSTLSIIGEAATKVQIKFDRLNMVVH